MDNDKLDEYALLAHTLVDAAIEKALNVLRTKCSETDLAAYRRENAPQKSRKIETDDNELSSEVPNIEWLKIEEFSPEKGEEKIHEFIKTWFYEDSWLYCIDLISTDELEFDTRYRYRVRWSIPTRRHPIPRATASVYFTIEVSKITPKDFPINVYYVIEGNRLVHRPGQIRFEEKWLKDVIESKILMLRAIDF